MAQVALKNHSAQEHAVPRLLLSLESFLIAGVVALALVLRVVALDTLPLNNAEAGEALAALHRIDPDVPDSGEALFPTNALGGVFNMLTMLLFGHGDAAARIPTAIAGTLLALTPLLYRRYLGRIATLLIMLGVAISPVSIMASRSMSGVVWSLSLVMVGGWFVLRFYETRQQGYSIAATVCLAGVLFLTSPLGILIALGLFCGLAWAVLGSPPNDRTRQVVPELASVWSGAEAFIASVIAVAVITTAFFTSPSGLSSLSQLLEAFFDGLTSRPAGVPAVYGLLVGLRYDLAYWLFGSLGIWMSWGESTFIERFLTGWFGWGVLSAVFYTGASADLALMITLPAVGLTVSFALRMLQTASYGFWIVPNWLLPLHSLVMIAMLISLTTGLQAIGGALQQEAEVTHFAKVLNASDGSTDNVRIGTLRAGTTGSSTIVNLPLYQLVNCQKEIGDRPETSVMQSAAGDWCDKEILTRQFTLLVNPIDAGAKEGRLTIRDPQGNTLYEPTPIGDELVIPFTAESDGDYEVAILQPDPPLAESAQYLIMIRQDDLTQIKGFDRLTSGAILLDFPNAYAALKIMARALRGWSLVLVVSLLLFIPLTFFLVGAIYGSRAAWRGVALGVLGFMAIYGMGMGWQATTRYGGDIREVWYQDAAPQDYHSLQSTLAEYSQRENGTTNLIPVLVQGEANGALAWALRDFPNAQFVRRIPADTTTAAMIALDNPRPTTAADYVGQQLVLDQAWELSSLNWTDALSWLTTRRTRYPLEVGNPYRLWIRADVYDVVNVPEQ
jgi:hypothetical protein